MARTKCKEIGRGSRSWMMVVALILKTCNLLNLIFVSKGENVRTTFVSSKGFYKLCDVLFVDFGLVCIIYDNTFEVHDGATGHQD
jgi:hypothetical protein